MKPAAIIFTSNTGFTRRYAEMMGKITGLPVHNIRTFKPDRDLPVIYMGWLMAANVKDYKRAYAGYDVRAVCGVGLCPTGAMLEEVRKTAKIPEKIPLFTVQGGMDHSRLKGIYKFMINMLIKVMSRKKDLSEQDRIMVQMIKDGGDFVDEKNLEAVLDWYAKQ